MANKTLLPFPKATGTKTAQQIMAEYQKKKASGEYTFEGGKWYSTTPSPIQKEGLPGPHVGMGEYQKTYQTPISQIGQIGTWIDANTGLGYSGPKRNANDSAADPTTGKVIQPQQQATPIFGDVRTGAGGVREWWNGKEWIPEAKSIDIGEEKQVVVTSDDLKDKEVEEETKKKEDDQKEIDDTTAEIEKLDLKKSLADARIALGLDPDTGLPAKPTTPTLQSDYDALRSEKGIGDIETQINTIDSDIRDIEAGLREQFETEEGRSVWTRLVGKEKSKLQDEARKQIDFLNRRKQTLVDELNTKNTVISNIMNLKQTDYNNAVDNYNTAFNQQMQMLNLVVGLENQQDLKDNRARDDARANLNIITNIAQTTNWEDLDPTLKAQIDQLEAKADLPIGITQAIFDATPDAEVMNTTTWTDDEGNKTVSVIYKGKDGKMGIMESMILGKTKGVGAYETVGQYLGLSKSVATKFDADLEEEIERVYKGEYGTEGAREQALRNLRAKYPSVDPDALGEVIYGSERFAGAFPDKYEEDIKTAREKEEEKPIEKEMTDEEIELFVTTILTDFDWGTDKWTSDSLKTIITAINVGKFTIGKDKVLLTEDQKKKIIKLLEDKTRSLLGKAWEGIKGLFK